MARPLLALLAASCLLLCSGEAGAGLGRHTVPCKRAMARAGRLARRRPRGRAAPPRRQQLQPDPLGCNCASPSPPSPSATGTASAQNAMETPTTVPGASATPGPTDPAVPPPTDTAPPADVPPPVVQPSPVPQPVPSPKAEAPPSEAPKPEEPKAEEPAAPSGPECVIDTATAGDDGCAKLVCRGSDLKCKECQPKFGLNDGAW